MLYEYLLEEERQDFLPNEFSPDDEHAADRMIQKIQLLLCAHCLRQASYMILCSVMFASVLNCTVKVENLNSTSLTISQLCT